MVDAGEARLSLWENGRMVDSMKVVVGKAETATPMMAAYIRFASVNPYWNVPPELVKSLIAPRVAAQGISYLTDREYQVLTDYSDDAERASIPTTSTGRRWSTAAQEVRLRRLPSPANSMGMMKFMLPNYFGIYLHDSPEKTHFDEERAVDQERLRPGRGLQALRALAVRRLGARRAPIRRSRKSQPARSRCRST